MATHEDASHLPKSTGDPAPRPRPAHDPLCPTELCTLQCGAGSSPTSVHCPGNDMDLTGGRWPVVMSTETVAAAS